MNNTAPVCHFVVEEYRTDTLSGSMEMEIADNEICGLEVGLLFRTEVCMTFLGDVTWDISEIRQCFFFSRSSQTINIDE